MPTANVNTSSSIGIAIAASTGKAIRVFAGVFQAAGDTSISLQGIVPGSSTTTYVGPMHQSAGTGFPIPPIRGDFWFQTEKNANLTIVNSGSVQVGGGIRYSYVDVN